MAPGPPVPCPALAEPSPRHAREDPCGCSSEGSPGRGGPWNGDLRGAWLRGPQSNHGSLPGRGRAAWFGKGGGRRPDRPGSAALWPEAADIPAGAPRREGPCLLATSRAPIPVPPGEATFPDRTSRAAVGLGCGTWEAGGAPEPRAGWHQDREAPRAGWHPGQGGRRPGSAVPGMALVLPSCPGHRALGPAPSGRGGAGPRLPSPQLCSAPRTPRACVSEVQPGS